MVRPNWSLFESKFPDYEDVFEWFVTLLFCRELDVKISLEGYFNQAAIEKNPVHSPDGKCFFGLRTLNDFTKSFLHFVLLVGFYGFPLLYQLQHTRPYNFLH